MEKKPDELTILREGEYEQIGDDVYCLFCGNKVNTRMNYSHAHGDDCDYLCSCAGAKEADKINKEMFNHQSRLLELKKASKNKLNWLKYVLAANQLASNHWQPKPFPLGTETPQPTSSSS